MSELALKAIAQNKRTKNKTLDLSNCELEEIPSEAFECVWVEELILTNSENEENKNRLHFIPRDIKALKNLTVLKAAGESGSRWNLTNMDFMKELPQLEYLDLHYNQIADAAPLAAAKKLRHLDLHTNNIPDFTVLVGHERLNYLDLGDNNTPEFDFLRALTGLEKLALSQNFIQDIRFLSNLRKLTHLKLGKNEIRSISPLENLTCLQFLDLHQNRINDIWPLRDLTRLKYLELSVNQISSVQPLDRLVDLQTLSLELNSGLLDVSRLAPLIKLEQLVLNIAKSAYGGSLQLPKRSVAAQKDKQDESMVEPVDFDFLKHFAGLKTLGLQGNRVKDIRFLDNLPLIRFLDLGDNLISEVEDLFPLAKYSKEILINVKGNPVLAKLPKEILEVGWHALHNRLIALTNGEPFIDLNEVKLLILGNTNVGKSNLLEYLETGVEPCGTASTHGIQFRALSNLVENKTVNCWDFGGQDYFHATYQLFFSPGAVNLVLWSKENITRLETDVCYDLRYWLRNVEQIIDGIYDNNGAKTDVIVCENKIDRQNFCPTPLDQTAFNNSFPRLSMVFTAMSLKPLSPGYLMALKGFLAMKIGQLTNIHPESYGEVLREIRRSKYDYVLTLEALNDPKIDDGIVLSVLHKMGVVLYFPGIMPGKVFHKPQLLLDLLYGKILSHELVRTGRFWLTPEEVEAAVQNNTLAVTGEEIIRLLEYFELIFRIPEELDRFFIPQYMPPPPPEIVELVFDQYRQVAVIIRSDQFLMNLAMLKIYNRYGRFVGKSRNAGYLFWKDAIVIVKDEGKILVRLNRAQDRIEICPAIHGDTFKLQDELVNFLIDVQYRQAQEEAIQIGPDGSTVTTYRPEDILDWDREKFEVFVSRDGEQFVNWKELVRRATVGAAEVDIAFRTEGTDGPARPLPVTDFKNFLPYKVRRKLKKKLFVCYAHEDAPHKSELKKYLANHVRSGLLELWDDGELRAGDDWDERIKQRLAEADICVLLVSQELIVSDYVNQVEFKTIMQRHEEECRVVPILLRNCDWRNWASRTLTRLQFLPLHHDRELLPVEKWTNPADAWLQISLEIRKLLPADPA